MNTEPRILVTGSAGAHKSTILKVLAAEGHLVLPEAATILWQGGYPGKNDPGTRASIYTQLAIAQIQHSMEATAAAKGTPHICDRGILDSVAYSNSARDLNANSDLSLVEGAVKLFCEAWGAEWTLWDLYRRYVAVIFLALPPEDEWRQNNTHRLEDYTLAKKMEDILLTLYAFHPNFYGIAGNQSTYDKIELVRRIVEREMAGSTEPGSNGKNKMDEITCELVPLLNFMSQVFLPGLSVKHATLRF